MIARAGIVKSAASFHGGDGAAGQGELSFSSIDRAFGDRLRSALRRRFFPNTALQPKQLAHAIGTTDRAVHKILAGDNDGRGTTVAAMVEFFVNQGDVALLHEIYAIPPLVFLREHRNAMQRVRRQVKELKRWLDAGEREVA